MNEWLIPSKVVDSAERQTNWYEALGVEGRGFAIEDLVVLGRKPMHGPFRPGKTCGKTRAGGRKIDWKSIRSEHQAKKKARRKKKRETAKLKLERKMRQQLVDDAS